MDIDCALSIARVMENTYGEGCAEAVAEKGKLSPNKRERESAGVLKAQIQEHSGQRDCQEKGRSKPAGG